MSARPAVNVFVLNTDPDINPNSICRRVVRSSMEIFKANPNQYTVTSTDLAADGWLDPLSAKDLLV